MSTDKTEKDDTDSHEVPPEIRDNHTRTFEYDIESGWPPKVAGAQNVRCIRSYGASQSFMVNDQRNYVQTVIRHPEVRGLLHGRWETLGCHLVAQADLGIEKDIRARVCLFNYTTNQLVEVFLEDGVVQSVALKEPYEHPESPVEVAQAISLVRSHPDVKSAVEGLDATGILQVSPDPNDPSYRHRCIYVMFTDHPDPHKELPVLTVALVDLNLQKVISYNLKPCRDEREREGKKDG